MKTKFSIVALMLIAFFSCDDNTGGMGFNVLPEKDNKVVGKQTFFDVSTSTIKAGKSVSTSDVGYVGRLLDKNIGEYSASYMTEMYCAKGLKFPETYKAYDKNGVEVDPDSPNAVRGTGRMTTKADENITLLYDENGKITGNIAEVQFILWYEKYYGDSLATNNVGIYELNKKVSVDEKNSTDINPENYYSEQDLLGSQTFTAVDFTQEAKEREKSQLIPRVVIRLDSDKAKKLGGRIVSAARKSPKGLNNDIFNDVLKGIYVKNRMGSQAVISVDITQLVVGFRCHHVDAKTGLKLKTKKGNDSIYFENRSFMSTPEVIMATTVKQNENELQERINDTESTYIQTPAGLITQAVLPVKEIEEKLSADTINIVKMSFANHSVSKETSFVAPSPKSLILLRKKDKTSFFVGGKLPNNKDSFVTNHNSSDNTYTFANVAELVKIMKNERKEALKKLSKDGKVSFKVYKSDGTVEDKTVASIAEWDAESDWDKIVLVPVSLVYDKTEEEIRARPELEGRRKLVGVYNQLRPSYIKLKGGANVNNKIRLEVVSTSF